MKAEQVEMAMAQVEGRERGHSIVVVVTPLIAIMKDQVSHIQYTCSLFIVFD